MASELINALFQLILLSAESKPHGSERIDALLETVSFADNQNEVQMGFQARQKLVFAALAGGRPELALTAFSWCLSHYDREPQAYSALGFLAIYKWAAGRLYHFPGIDRSAIESTLGDLELRFRNNDEPLHPVWLIRRDVAIGMGDVRKAGQCDRKYKQSSRGTLSDCPACTIDGEVEYAFDLGKDELAIEHANRIFSGRMKCGQVPHKTHALVLLPLLKLGRVEEAMEHHRLGYRLIRDNPAYVHYSGMHIALLALTGNARRALQLVERHAADGLQGKDPYHEYHFLRYCWLAIETISSTRKRAKMRLPALNESIAGEKQYELADLARAMAERGLDVASQFDHRNGNDYYTRLWYDAKKWQTYAT